MTGVARAGPICSFYIDICYYPSFSNFVLSYLVHVSSHNHRMKELSHVGMFKDFIRAEHDLCTVLIVTSVVCLPF